MNLRREARWLWPISAIVVIALVCGAYVLNRQRLESPLADRYVVHLELAAVDAVRDSVGSPVTVAGVAVGQIDQVRLVEGRGVLRLRLDPAKLPRVHRGAQATLVPNTPLKDMQVRLKPGSRRAPALPDGATIPLRSTTSPIDADELLRALDTDTRAWVQSLIADLGTGTDGRGGDLRRLLRRLGPTAAQLREITGLVAARRRQLPQLVTDLRQVSEAVAGGDEDLRRALAAAEATLGTLGREAEPLRRTLARLPGTLGQARTTLARTRPFARTLRRSLTTLDPALTRLPATLRSLPAAAAGLVPLPTASLEGLVDALAPLSRTVGPAARDLTSARAPLDRAFATLARATDALAHKPDDGEGYAFWLAWFAHNLNSVLSTQDAHGAVIRGYVLLSCGSVADPRLGEALGRLTGPRHACPGGGGPRR